MDGVRPRPAGGLPRFPVVRAALLYYAAVFGAGFVLGPIRILWLVPRVGERAAELLELPLMVAVMLLAARAVSRRPDLPPAPMARLGTGLLALALVLVSEFSLVLWLRGLTLAEYFATRDPVAGTAYYLSLALFGLLPWLLQRRAARPD